MSVLVVTAVDAERKAVTRDLGPGTAHRIGPYDVVRVQTAAGEVDVAASGVGPADAAATTATLLALGAYDTAISAGLAGGFAGRAKVGDVVVADTMTVADLGCRTDGGFLPLRDLGLDYVSRRPLPIAHEWRERLFRAGLGVVSGEVLTLSSMTGTQERGDELAELYPYAVAEAMEGWGVMTACRGYDTAVGEVRAISNIVGPRIPEQWDIAGAFDALSRAFAVLFEAPVR